jgi:Bifunctional DNA primase/polymerase, N-terminal/AAA domain
MKSMALWYAGGGIHVFPLNGKAPLTVHGFHDATTDPAQIEAWWTRHPDAGIGTPDFDAIDVDLYKPECKETWKQIKPLIPEGTPHNKTGGGGLQFLFRAGTLRDGKIGPGVDNRYAGRNYIVLPPSRHPSGSRYEAVVDVMVRKPNPAPEFPQAGGPSSEFQQLLVQMDAGEKIADGRNKAVWWRAVEVLRTLPANTDLEPVEALMRSWVEDNCAGDLATVDVPKQVRGAAKTVAQERRPVSSPADDDPPAPALIVDADEFAAVDEPGASALLGSDEEAVLTAGGDSMLYGDGGAGKTTLAIDLAVHLAAGMTWLGIEVPRPVCVLLLENEGPRQRYRKKIQRKLAGWNIKGRLKVWDEPWGKAGFGNATQQQQLADAATTHDVDILIAGPLTRLGMDEAGTLQQVRDFTLMVQRVRELSGRALHVLLIHHENRAGQVSGAWEGAGDTLLHMQAQGHGRARLHFQKVRWSSEWHKKSLNLLWADGEGFEVEEREELDDDAAAELVLAAIRSNPGASWTRVEERTKGIRAERRRQVRDGLLAARRIVNVVKENGVETALDHCPERRPSRLHAVDDPTIAHLRPARDADGTQTASAAGELAQMRLRPASRLIGTQDGTQLVSPDESTTEDTR